MSRLLCILLFCLVPVLAYAADPQVRLEGEKIVVTRGGKSVTLPPDALEAGQVEKTPWRYLATGPDEKKDYGLKPGLYVFDASGKLAAFAATDGAEFCATVRLSPGGTVLAMDAGTSHVRGWQFFSFPAMKPLEKEPVTYYLKDPDLPDLLWAGETDVLFTTIEETERECDYEVCNPSSVMRRDLAKHTSTTLFKGTPLCDYALVSLADGLVTADKLCLPDAKAWKEAYPGSMSGEKITAKLR